MGVQGLKFMCVCCRYREFQGVKCIATCLQHGLLPVHTQHRYVACAHTTGIHVCCMCTGIQVVPEVHFWLLSMAQASC